MNNKCFKPIAYQGKRPVSLEREENDVVVIEGIRFDGEFFRQLAYFESNVLFRIRRIDGEVIVEMANG